MSTSSPLLGVLTGPRLSCCGAVREGAGVYLEVVRGLIYGVSALRWQERAETIWSLGKMACTQNAPGNRGHANVLKERHSDPGCSSVAENVKAACLMHPVQPFATQFNFLNHESSVQVETLDNITE